MYNQWRNNHKVFQIRKKFTPRRSDICLCIHFSVKSCICSNQIKSNQNIDKLRIFEHDFMYTTYADDSTFFVKNQTSVIEMLKVFDKFSKI